MFDLVDRFGPLIARLEAGGSLPSKEEVRRLELLTALDAVKLGQDFVRQTMAADDALTERLRQQAEQNS